jgi:hypothetical protein
VVVVVVVVVGVVGVVVGAGVLAGVEVVGVEGELGVVSAIAGSRGASVAAETTCHVPPKLWMLSPFAAPLALSPEKW